ncbi:protein Daple-like [Oppia nitens]|uniref:protein Daple-like n=1 Tax=Oppia nitens TaxID=1686743 RepID=UPI0023DC15F6|nr:protein Daple-like [Oppia nitens]
MMGSNCRSITPFMCHPLVTWVNSLQKEKCTQKEIKDYSGLSSGALFTNVWLQIDSEPSYQFVANNNDRTSRLKNLNALLNNIRKFYETVLDQTIVLRYPDIIKIAQNPSDESSICEEMFIILLLMLGCAVQCERKEHFIDAIKQLDISVQHSIVECIQKITDNPESVWINSEWNVLPENEDEKHRLYDLLVQHISELVKERDDLFNRVIDLQLELDTIYVNESVKSTNSSVCMPSLDISNSVSDQKSHVLVELAEVKSKLRRVQQELEEKNEIVSELKEIVEQSKESCNKLKDENLELIQEARSAKTYRDEIDVLNEKVGKVDRLENEVQRYKDKLNELDFYKSRVEELREDNRILSETKVMLEEQLETSRKRADQLPELESQILKLSSYSNEMVIQKDLDRNKMERYIEEITQLRFEKKSSAEELSRVQSELAHLKCQMKIDLLQQNGEGNLLDQINNDASKRVLNLELENQRLQSLVENIKNNQKCDTNDSFLNYNNINHTNGSNSVTSDDGFISDNQLMEKIAELEDENKKFDDKNKSLENENKKLEDQNKKLKDDYVILEEENKKIKDDNKKFDDKNKSLNEEHNRLQTEYKMLQNIYKKLRTDYNDLKLRHTDLQGETQECRDRMTLLDVEVSKLANYCEIVALTNNSIESHRKRLINNIANLLTQYHDLLTEISGDSEKLITDKVHDLSTKKKKLDKMIKEYDLTLEKKKVAVSSHNVVRRIHRSSTELCLSSNTNLALREQSRDRKSAPIDNLIDEAIYGRIWEAQTPPIASKSALRPITSTSNSLYETHNGKPLENVKQMVNEALNQIKEEIVKSDNTLCPTPPPRPPPRVSTTIENKIQLSVITSPTLTQSSASPPDLSATTASNCHSFNNFTRGTFKSNSINYGSPIRRQQLPFKNGVHHIHHFHHLHPHSASPSLNSDSSLTPLEDSELSDSAVNNQRSQHLNNCDNVTINSNATNSVWYEYGCV